MKEAITCFTPAIIGVMYWYKIYFVNLTPCPSPIQERGDSEKVLLPSPN